MTNSPLVAMILGIILSEHVRKDTDYDDVDLVISQALDSAVDSDIQNLYDLMGKYIDNADNIFTAAEDEMEKYGFTLHWARSNRIIDRAYGKFEDDKGISGFRFALDGYYEINECTRRLYGYCERIKQVLIDPFEE